MVTGTQHELMGGDNHSYNLFICLFVCLQIVTEHRGHFRNVNNVSYITGLSTRYQGCSLTTAEGLTGEVRHGRAGQALLLGTVRVAGGASQAPASSGAATGCTFR